MFIICLLYGRYMFVACSLYVVCSLYVCCMSVICLLYVCCMFVACSVYVRCVFLQKEIEEIKVGALYVVCFLNCLLCVLVEGYLSALCRIIEEERSVVWE